MIKLQYILTIEYFSSALKVKLSTLLAHCEVQGKISAGARDDWVNFLRSLEVNLFVSRMTYSE